MMLSCMDRWKRAKKRRRIKTVDDCGCARSVALRPLCVTTSALSMST